MDEKSARSVYERKAADLAATLIPNGGAATISEHRLAWALDQVAQVAFTQGESFALLDLITSEDAAAELGVSVRRTQAKAADLERRGFPAGMRVGRGWIFRRSDLERLRGGPVGNPNFKKS